jgi:hypothetical protein
LSRRSSKNEDGRTQRRYIIYWDGAVLIEAVRAGLTQRKQGDVEKILSINGWEKTLFLEIVFLHEVMLTL